MPHDARRQAGPWVRLAALVLCRGYRGLLLSLVAVAVAPVLLGWSSFVVESGSMEPEIGVGDVVVAQPLPEDSDLPLGRVMVFDNPARAGDLLVHRVIAREDDGTYTTAGDANALPDSTPVARSAFRDRAVLLAPWVGRPLRWWQTRDLVPLAAWILFTLGAFALAIDPQRAERRRGRHRQDPTSGRSARRPGRRIHARRTVAVAARIAASTAALSLVLTCAGSTAGAAFTARTVNSGMSWQVGTILQPYVASVLADDPFLLYLLDEPSGTWAEDKTQHGHTGRYTSVSAYGQAGALAHNPGSSITPGASGRVIPDDAAIVAPSAFTIELWFRTTSTAGGLLAGFENSRNAYSGTADRQLRIDTRGRVVYGDWGYSAAERPVLGSKGYNDGAWHHVAVAATGTGTSHKAWLFVDGVLVDSGSATSTSSYTGWWRVGSGTQLSPILAIPSAGGFPGQVDNVAIYHKTLDAARVAAHYAAR